MQDSAWADGLRGIASLFVVSSHLSLCFAQGLVNPCCGDDATRTPSLFQRPIFRLIASGHGWVAVFFVLLGFVNALEPLKQARKGNAEAALVNLSTASFRRSFRLVLPATTATVFSWILCQSGAYSIARDSDAYWLHANTPLPSTSWGTALEDLVSALQNTWLLGRGNVYDHPQWALIYLLQGSICVFFVLVATVSLASRWRVYTVAACMLWSYTYTQYLYDPMVGFTVLGGVLLAEFILSNKQLAISNITLVSTVLVPLFTTFSLVLMSMPSENVDLTTWSRTLKWLALKPWPHQPQWVMERFVGSTGALILCYTIVCSPWLRHMLSVKPLRWLGKLSFPIYLLHGSFMRSVMAWVVFGGRPVGEFDNSLRDGEKVSRRYTKPGPMRIWLGILLSMGLMLYASHVWANHMEPIFRRITAWAEGKMKGVDGGLGIITGKVGGSEWKQETSEKIRSGYCRCKNQR